MKANVASALTGSLPDQIAARVGPKIVNEVLVDLVPSMAETLSDRLTMSLQAVLEKRVPPSMYPIVTERVTTTLSQPAAIAVGEYIEEVAPYDLANALVHDLGKILTRSLGSSLVATLTQTLSHSPMMDYFCYYCHHHKLYCAYCKVAPYQLYYSAYYHDYFTLYYTPYYVQYFSAPGFQDWSGEQTPNAKVAPEGAQVVTPDGSGDTDVGPTSE
jgi:hypothetical protein